MREFFKTYTEKAPALSKKNRLFDSVLLIAVAFLLVLLKPFGLTQIGFLATTGYWAVICIAGYFTYAPIFYFGEKVLLNFKLPYPLILISLALIASFIMCFEVTLISSLYFDVPANFREQFPTLFPQSLVIGAILISVSIIRDYIKSQNELIVERHSQPQLEEPATRFLQRLPLNLRGQLLCLEMDDHYVKVHTDKGRHLILMRMKDAIVELEGYKGLQAHRSWWVSEDAILKSIKKGRSYSLLLSNDMVVPISRTYLPEFRLRNIV